MAICFAHPLLCDSVYSKSSKGSNVCSEHGEGLSESPEASQTVCCVFLWTGGKWLKGGAHWASVSWL